MTVTVKTDSFTGAKGQTEDGDPSIAGAVRAAATDLAAIVSRSDTDMQTKVDELVSQQLVLRTKLDSLIGNYTGHLAQDGVHVGADTENGIAATAATDPVADVLVLVNDAAAMYIAHVAQGAAIHPGGLDAVNALTATNPATNEAEAGLLMTDIKDQYELHRANNGGAYHTNPDATNTIAEPDGTDWDTTVTLANAFKNTTGFNAHVILTAGPVHGATGVADIITAPNCGVQIAALYVELIELKDDYSLHTVQLGYHVEAGAVEATADATTEATAVALANAFKATLNVHFADTGVHLTADPETIVAADCTEYEDILVLVLECRTDYTAHLLLAAVHPLADAGNAETVVGAGGDVTVLGAGGVVTPTLVAG